MPVTSSLHAKLTVISGEKVNANILTIRDEGPLAELVVHPQSPKKITGAAVSIVGPNTIAQLIDQLLTIDRQIGASAGQADRALHDERYRLLNWIASTRLSSFAEAILTRSDTRDPRDIALLAEMLARHGEVDNRGPLPLRGPLYTRIVDTVERWMEILLASTVATRQQYAEVAQAIERLPAPQLVPGLQRLLAADLVQWQRARDEATIARAQSRPPHPDAYHAWTLQYRRAFAAIGDSQTVALMKTYLPTADFSVDAAMVLKMIWDRAQNMSNERRFTSWPDFSDVAPRRAVRLHGHGSGEASPFVEAICSVIDDLTKPGAGIDAHRRALHLATIAFSMPYGEKTGTLDTLLQLPLPLAEKQRLLTVLILAGEIMGADMILDGIKELLAEAKTQPWRLDSNRGELEEWLMLLPFSDRPRATLEALALLEDNRKYPWLLRRRLSALGYAPAPDAEDVLCRLAQSDQRFLSDYDWLAALDNRGTASAARLLLDFICEGAFTNRPGGINTWTLSHKLTGAMQRHTGFRAEVYQRYAYVHDRTGKAILEHAIAEAADMDGVLVLVQSYGLQGKPFDGLLYAAIEHVAVGKRPAADWPGAHEVCSVPIPELRQRLFALVKEDTAETRLAMASLTTVDELRDRYGLPESEPRHPDIESERPWPLLT